MKKKQMTALIIAAAMTISMLSGCGNQDAAESSAPSSSGESGSTQEQAPDESDGQDAEESGGQEADGGGDGQFADVVAFEDIEFPDALPQNPTLAEDGWYGWDDMSVHYELEFLTDHYGEEMPSHDPIAAWLGEKFNVTIKLTTVATGDMENILSTRFASNDLPDLFALPNRDYGFTLGEQGLLVDAREMYSYMPQTRKFVTKTLIEYTTLDDGTIPMLTKYPVQDGDIWALALNTDWLDKLGMSMPTTLDELKEYAKACTFDDPDGNGQDDTWFMTGAGGGKSWQSLKAFQPWFGNPSAHAENGKLVHPMLDGSTKGWISFMNELCEMGTFAPDWFTIDWETAKSYMLQNRLGALYYPAGNLFLEIVRSHDWDYSLASSWEYLPSLPEGRKGTAGGNAGYMWAIPKSNVEGDQGKLLRILHILDTVCYGGENYFEIVNGGGNQVHGIDTCVREYLEDGLCYCTTPPDHPGFDGTYGTTNLNLAPWQTLGLSSKWVLEHTPDDAGEDQRMYVDKINEGKKVIASYDRWPNDNLLSAVNINEIAPNLTEFELQQQYKFVVGERSMDEWDDFVTEWLNQGGRDVLAAQAEKLGVELPDEAK